MRGPQNVPENPKKFGEQLKKLRSMKDVTLNELVLSYRDLGFSFTSRSWFSWEKGSYPKDVKLFVHLLKELEAYGISDDAPIMSYDYDSQGNIINPEGELDILNLDFLSENIEDILGDDDLP